MKKTIKSSHRSLQFVSRVVKVNDWSVKEIKDYFFDQSRLVMLCRHTFSATPKVLESINKIHKPHRPNMETFWSVNGEGHRTKSLSGIKQYIDWLDEQACVLINSKTVKSPYRTEVMKLPEVKSILEKYSPSDMSNPKMFERVVIYFKGRGSETVVGVRHLIPIGIDGLKLLSALVSGYESLLDESYTYLSVRHCRLTLAY